jgi:antitoxin component YwqK of YwqJK toxin-antitoxin module
MRKVIIIILTLVLFGCADIRKEYYSNGQIKSEIEYKDDISNGSYIFYGKNGNVEQKGRYLNGEKEGLCIWYYKNGNIDTKANYENGIENGIITHFFETGELQDSGIFINGIQEGIIYTYFKNGKIDREQEYKNGHQNGYFKSYYKNDMLKMYAEIRNDTTTYYIEYDSLGNAIDEYSDCSNCNSNDYELYKLSIVISGKDYLVIDSTEVIKLKVDNVPNICLGLSVSNGTLFKSKYVDEYKVRVKKSKNNKVRFAVSMLCDTSRIYLGMIEKEIRIE